VSGPLLDRFDLRITVKPVDAAALLEGMSIGGTPASASAAAQAEGAARRAVVARPRPTSTRGPTGSSGPDAVGPDVPGRYVPGADVPGADVALAPGTVSLPALAWARERQRERARRLGLPRASNARIPPHALRAAVCATREATDQVLESARKMSLSGRGIHRALRVARTIADLENVPHVSDKHVREALQYRGEDA